MAPGPSLQLLLCNALLAVAVGYPFLVHQPQIYSAALTSQSLVQVPKPVEAVPVYKDTAPIMPRSMDYVDLKAYESAVVDLLAEVDRKDRAPNPQNAVPSTNVRRIARHRMDVDGLLGMNPFEEMRMKMAQKMPMYADGSVLLDNGGSLGAGLYGSQGVMPKAFRPVNIDIPGIFNLQIYRDQNGQRRIGIGILPGWNRAQPTDPPRTVETTTQPASPNEATVVPKPEAVVAENDPKPVSVVVGNDQKPVSVVVGNHPRPLAVSVTVGSPPLQLFHYY